MTPVVMVVPALLHGGGPHFDILRGAGFEVRMPPPGSNPRQVEELGRIIAEADAVLAGTEPYTPEVLGVASHLRVISRAGVGYDAIDLAAADERRIAVTTTPGCNHEAVAEHALAMLLALARGIPRRDRQVRRGEFWTKVPMPRFAGSTLGIVGLGRSGKALARRAAALGVNVIAHTPRPDARFAGEFGIELVDFESLMRRSDFVSLHLPLTQDTRGLINRRSLAWMKQGAVLVNTARGGVVVEEDLHAALSCGALGGAGIDVFDAEPPDPGHPLLQLDNVLVTQHISGLDSESYRDQQSLAAQNIVDLWQGRWPSRCVMNLRQSSGWRW